MSAIVNLIGISCRANLTDFISIPVTIDTAAMLFIVILIATGLWIPAIVILALVWLFFAD